MAEFTYTDTSPAPSPQMKQIGTTSSGSVVVEMTTQEYDALKQIQAGGPSTTPKAAADQGSSNRMSPHERAAYVAERLPKLSPKKKEGAIRSIEAMFQFHGGIDAAEATKILATLERQKFLSITPDGRVTFSKT